MLLLSEFRGDVANDAVGGAGGLVRSLQRGVLGEPDVDVGEI